MNPARTSMAMNPPHLTAGLMVTASNESAPRMGARDHAQSWRGKYLRALNITPAETTDTTDTGKVKLRSMSFHRADADGDRNARSRSYSSSTKKEEDARKSLERSTPSPPQHHHQPRIRHTVPLRGPMTPPMNPYGFATKPALARGRRCHTDPFVYAERLSAPIEIPSASAMVNQLDGNARHDAYTSPLSMNNRSKNPVPLLSWEEPVASPAAADDEEEEEEDDLEEDEDDDDDDHIFAMEEVHDESRCTSTNRTRNGKSRRRLRTESLSIISSGREKRVHHAFGADLSKSFVPPHQLVERNCFSIGLRDELRRRPTNNV